MNWISDALSRKPSTFIALVLGAGSVLGAKALGLRLGMLAAICSLIGGAMLLMAQEDESDELRTEISRLSNQVTQLVDGKVVDQSQRGFATRLNNPRRLRFRSIWKTVGLYLLILGAGYSMISA